MTDFATPVTTVNATPQGKNVRVGRLLPQGLWEHTAYQSDNQFVVEVKPLKEDPSKLFQGSQRQGYQGEKVSLNFQNIPAARIAACVRRHHQLQHRDQRLGDRQRVAAPE